MESVRCNEDVLTMERLRQWFEKEVDLHRNSALPDRFYNVRNWNMEHAETWPKQSDGKSCGVTVLGVQASLACGFDPTFLRTAASRMRSTLLLSLIWPSLNFNSSSSAKPVRTKACFLKVFFFRN